MVALGIFKVVCYGLMMGAILIGALLLADLLGKGLVRAWDWVAEHGRVAARGLLPTDWTKVKRKTGVVFCGEVWYDLPVAAQWITLDRWGLIQCWQAKPEYCPEDGEWYSHQLNQPFDVGHMASEWYLPFAGQPVPPMLALPEDIYETDAV